MNKKLALALLFLAGSLWAEVAGTWKAEVVLVAGSGAATFTFRQEGETLSGTYSGTLGQAGLRGTQKGDQAEWSFELAQIGTVTFKGTLDGTTKMKGSAQYGALGSGTFTATKQ
jgi:hypothetical protein